MVLRVCRRMLADSPDADDAFQAVFLVLARKAGAIRRVEGLKSWLFGVAVRTAKEARRRSAKRREREGAAMDDSRAEAQTDGDRGEWIALLDEEIQRLPSRYRDPLLLCELEGMPRHDAALRLELPEGTLSSRLARGRSLLRDRLRRRGVSLGAAGLAALVSDRAIAALPEPLIDSTVHLALKFAAGGASAGIVPAAVSSLAEGVIAMMTVARIKLALVGALTLGTTASLMAGLALAFVPKPVAMPPEATRSALIVDEPATDKPPSPKTIEARGVVVDEAGRPVAGAEVRLVEYDDRETRCATAADGSFAIPILRDQLDGRTLLARSAEGDRLGLFLYGDGLPRVAPPARIVLKPAREVVVRVVDASKSPVAGAAVEAAGNYVALAHATTGADGSARLLVPADSRVDHLVALKAGRGLDYAEYGEIGEDGQSRGGVPAGELPATVELTLEGGRTALIRAVDREGKPLAGVGFAPWLLHKEGRRSSLNYTTRIFTSTTGANGIAIFDWLPPWKRSLDFWPWGEGFAHRRVGVDESETRVITAKLARTQAIRGRVINADGTPALGIRIRALGTGDGRDHGQSRARSASDGTFEMLANSGEAYAIYVDEKDWAAPTRFGVVVHEARPAEGVDFTIGKGTILRGTVTVDPGNRPAPEQYVLLGENGGSAPKELLEEGNTTLPEVTRRLMATTDAQGRYAIRIGPGTYTVSGPMRAGSDKITVGDEAEIIRDFRMPRPEKGPVSGRVVDGEGGRGVAGISVQIHSANWRSVPFGLTTDAQGRFQAERFLDKTFFFARTADGSRAAIVEIGAEDPDVVIPLAATASASGVMLDRHGEVAKNRKLDWGRRIFVDGDQGPWMTLFATKVETDAEGRFTLPSLVVGQPYTIALQEANGTGSYNAGSVQPDRATAIDLGTLRAGSDQETSSFTKDAPDAGKVAPAIEATTLEGKPIALADFRGKYVLLDFWATWCGPCIKEIPQLQAVHDAFGKDERFAILSLSVDEKIDEPRAFQEKRKLPWSQAFLGGGLHGATPGTYGVRAIPAFVLVGPDGSIVARGMRGEGIKKEVEKALAKRP